jgi:hypothetical protein
MRRVEGRGFLMRQQENREKESLQTSHPASLIRLLALRLLSQITRSHYLKMTTWKKKAKHQPILLFQVVGQFS